MNRQPSRKPSADLFARK